MQWFIYQASTINVSQLLSTINLSVDQAFCESYTCIICSILYVLFVWWLRWPGGATVLGKLSVPGRPTILIKVEQRQTALAVGAGGVVWAFLLSSILSLLFLPLFGRRPDID